MSNEHANPHSDTEEIIINAQPYQVPKGSISFLDVVRLSFGVTGDAANAYTVTYERGHDDQHSGILAAGGSVKVKKGMVFNATATGMS